MINTNEILDTIHMIDQQHLDVRTITMGISLLDCADPDGRKACEKIYRKITEKAKDLVKTAEDISATYGMPIVNKRISVTPIAMLLASAPDADPVWYAKTLDAAAKAVGVNFIGGYSALVHKGFSAGDERLIRSIPEALACTDYVCSSINVGSTKSGIAPFYSDKYAKIGIQVCDLFHEDRLMERLTAALTIKNVLFQHLYHKPALDAQELFQQLLSLREEIRPYVGDAVGFVHQALKEGKTILLEGQLGSMKDPDLGIFPMTTSSHTLAGFGCVGAAIPPTAVEDVICVTKAYSSNVGSQTEPFVSELTGEAGDELRRRGGDQGEFGATTGRPRRVGWFDAVATKYGCMIQGATQVALTCLDVLGYLDEIQVCTGYEIDGQVTDRFPVTPLLKKAKPVFTTLPGWKCDIRGCKDYNALPQQAKDYVDFLEAHIGAPITMVSSGPKREEMTYRTPKL